MNFKASNQISLRLEPTGDDSKKILEPINYFDPKTLGTPFTPYITLLSNIKCEEEEIIERFMKFVKPVDSFKITFQKVKISDNSSEGITLRCHKSKELIELNARAQKVFKTPGSFSPHLNLPCDNIKSAMKIKRVRLYGEKKLLELPFTASTLNIWEFKDEIKKWKKILAVKL